MRVARNTLNFVELKKNCSYCFAAGQDFQLCAASFFPDMKEIEFNNLISKID